MLLKDSRRSLSTAGRTGCDRTQVRQMASACLIPKAAIAGRGQGSSVLRICEGAAAAAEAVLTWVYLPSAPGSALGGRQIRTGLPRRGLRRRRAAAVAAMASAWRNSPGDAH